LTARQKYNSIAAIIEVLKNKNNMNSFDKQQENLGNDHHAVEKEALNLYK
jgi:hypothetical protein